MTADHKLKFWSALRSAPATPVSAALLFALLGSESLFDVFISAFDQSRSVSSFDADAVARYRAACQSVLRMQKHIARTLDIARCYVAYTEIRIMRSVCRPRAFKSKVNVAKVAHARELAEEHRCPVLLADICFEEALLEFICAKELTLSSSLGVNEANLRQDQCNRALAKLDATVAQFASMGHVAKKCRAKHTIKQISGRSKEGLFGGQLQMVEEWFE